jgi:uncharacterized protein (DUF1778 family)
MKSTLLNVTVTVQARDSIHQAAERAGMSYSDFVRQAVLEACQAQGVNITEISRPVGWQVGHPRQKGK